LKELTRIVPHDIVHNKYGKSIISSIMQ